MPAGVMCMLQNLRSFSETVFFTKFFLLSVFITLLIVGLDNPNFFEMLHGVSNSFSLIIKSKSIES